MRKRSVTEVKPPEVQDQKAAQPGAVEQPQCRHHWLIETPQGATSKGVCKLCGAVREFRNAVSATYWESDSSDLGEWGRRSRSFNIASDEDEFSMAPPAEPALTV